jgi:hypothetical protein
MKGLPRPEELREAADDVTAGLLTGRQLASPRRRRTLAPAFAAAT